MGDVWLERRTNVLHATKSRSRHSARVRFFDGRVSKHPRGIIQDTVYPVGHRFLTFGDVEVKRPTEHHDYFNYFSLPHLFC